MEEKTSGEEGERVNTWDALPGEEQEARAVLASHVPDPISCSMCGPAEGRWPCSAVFLARTVLALVDLVRLADRAIDRGWTSDVSEYLRARKAFCVTEVPPS